MTRAGERARTAQLVALLAVVLGLFAMHGLVSPHHAVAATHLSPAAALSAGAGGDAVSQHGAGHDRHDSRTAAAPDASGATCDDDCPVAMLCLAMLTAATAAMALTVARRRRWGAALRQLPQPRAPTAARQALRPPDLVAELCISRT